MINVENLSINKGNFALQGISFRIPHQSWGVLMGRSGCGKTTLVEAICGLTPVLRGRVYLGERDVTVLHPSVRNIGYVPQDLALFPGRTVRGNLAFALEIRRWNKDRVKDRIEEISALLGIGGLLERFPGGLSGGESQLVAIGRAISFYPEILCLDEPLSSLDQNTREEMYEVLEHMKKNTGITVLHVTHNKEEAYRLGDLIIKLKDGQISRLTRCRCNQEKKAIQLEEQIQKLTKL